MNWTGGPVRELMTSDGKRLGRFDGKSVQEIGAGPNEAGSSCNITADLAGDYRDEVVCISSAGVFVYTNLDPLNKRDVTRTANREYRLWLARNMGGGYASYFEWQP